VAVDTAAKRHSALHFLDDGIPLPDGAIGQGDRATLLGLYSGFTIGSVPDPSPEVVRLSEQSTLTLSETATIHLAERATLRL
jgi:hypothetical protein